MDNKPELKLAVNIGSTPVLRTRGMNMKTKEQVKKETGADVFTLKEFIRICDEGGINSCDGHGYFHDGEKETCISCWNNEVTWDDVKDFPFICWYNK